VDILFERRERTGTTGTHGIEGHAGSDRRAGQRLSILVRSRSFASFASLLQWHWRFDRRGHNFRELAALQELPALAAAAGDAVLRGADGLLGAARRLDDHQVAVAR